MRERRSWKSFSIMASGRLWYHGAEPWRSTTTVFDDNFRLKRDVVVAYFNISRHFPGGTNEVYEKHEL